VPCRRWTTTLGVHWARPTSPFGSLLTELHSPMSSGTTVTTPRRRYTNLCQCRVERGARGCAGCPEHRRCPQARASKREGRYSFAHCRRHPQNESTSRVWTLRPKIARTPLCNRDRAVSSLFSSVPAAHSAAPTTTNPHVHAQSRHAQQQSILTKCCAAEASRGHDCERSL
jgi:hypothetical protein